MRSGVLWGVEVMKFFEAHPKCLFTAAADVRIASSRGP